MTEDEVRAAAQRLVGFHERFAPLFGKEQAQDHAYTYVKGLMVCPERKSIEPIAINVGDGNVSALQKFLNIAPWGHDDVQDEIPSVFADELVPTAVASAIGVVGVVDESGFAKKGEVHVEVEPGRPVASNGRGSWSGVDEEIAAGDRHLADGDSGSGAWDTPRRN